MADSTVTSLDDEKPSLPTGLNTAQQCRLRAFIWRKARDSNLVDEVFQETYKRLLEAMHRKSIKEPLSYAYKVAENLIKASYSDNNTLSGDLLDDLVCENPQPDRVLLGRERYEIFRAAIEKLPPMRKEVFLRRRIASQSSKQIAHDLGISSNAVDKHVSRAMISLQGEMKRAERQRRINRINVFLT